MPSHALPCFTWFPQRKSIHYSKDSYPSLRCHTGCDFEQVVDTFLYDFEKFDAASGEAMVKELSQGNGMGPWVHPIRVAVSGRTEGPGLFEMLELLGRDRTVARLKAAAEKYAL